MGRDRKAPCKYLLTKRCLLVTELETGVCLVSDEVEQGGFQKEEEAMLTCFCDQVSIAIEASQRVSRIMQTEGIRPADTSAAEYLIGVLSFEVTIQVTINSSLAIFKRKHPLRSSTMQDCAAIRSMEFEMC